MSEVQKSSSHHKKVKLQLKVPTLLPDIVGQNLLDGNVGRANMLANICSTRG